MTVQSTWYNKKYIKIRKEFVRKGNRQNFGNVPKHELNQQINSKFLSIIAILHTNSYFRNINLKVDYHIVSKLFIHGLEHRKENLLLSLKHSFWSSTA